VICSISILVDTASSVLTPLKAGWYCAKSFMHEQLLLPKHNLGLGYELEGWICLKLVELMFIYLHILWMILAGITLPNVPLKLGVVQLNVIIALISANRGWHWNIVVGSSDGVFSKWFVSGKWVFTGWRWIME
jgi:hypothetical protein